MSYWTETKQSRKSSRSSPVSDSGTHPLPTLPISVRCIGPRSIHETLQKFCWDACFRSLDFVGKMRICNNRDSFIVKEGQDALRDIETSSSVTDLNTNVRDLAVNMMDASID